MDVDELQARIGTVIDGKWGSNSTNALYAAFTNTAAPAVTPDDIAAIAARLGVSVKQVNAVAAVESSGAGFDSKGRPKILYERHIFDRLTGGRYSVTNYSNPSGGGYSDDSWAKLAAGCGADPDAALSACSWGRFQVMGMHWAALGFLWAWDLAQSTVESEAAHFELLARFIEVNGLKDEMRALSTNPDDCRPFAKGYNGSGYEAGNYHVKLANAMK